MDKLGTQIYFFEGVRYYSVAVQVLHLQFSTKYLRWDGVWCQRVTTISRRWVAGVSLNDLSHGFDQEAAAVMMSRYVTWKMETEEDFDATRWIDRSLIRLCQRCVGLFV